MAASILRLLMLLACMNHLVGCAWWYVGTVNIPPDFDGMVGSEWIQHAAIPTISLIDNLDAHVASGTTPAERCSSSWLNAPPQAPRVREEHAKLNYSLGMDALTEIDYLAQKYSMSTDVLTAISGNGTALTANQVAVGAIDAESKIPSAYINGAWVPLTESVPSVDTPEAFDSWVMYHRGLGVPEIWRDRSAIIR